MQQKAVFLDRDGVLNQAIVKNGKPYPPASLAEVVIPSDARDALMLLKNAGFLLIGATNQPDVARGTTPRALVDNINQLLMTQLPLDEIRVCFHDDNDNCACRKPLPGLLLDAAAVYQIDLQNSFMIGDRWKDIDAGQRAGCQSIWLNHQYTEKSPETPDYTVSSLTEAAHWIISHPTSTCGV
jgi:D-glycero-D-manno-heptose 1,7-bisphosphate phosphatase